MRKCRPQVDMSSPSRCDAQFVSFLNGKRRVLRFMITLVTGLVASLNSVAVASAQTYPQRAVKFILPFGPAAGVDISARLLGEKLAARWGKPVVIETGRAATASSPSTHSPVATTNTHALVRSGFDLHCASIYARKTTLRCGARPASDHERYDHCDCAFGTDISERQDTRRIHCARPRKAKYAQRGRRRWQFRPDLVGFHQDPGLTSGARAVP